jgi:hypothetical protein
MPGRFRLSPPSRVSRTLVCLLLAVALGAASPVPALSAGVTGGNSFSELTGGQPETQTTTTNTSTAAKTTTETSTSNSRTLILGASGAAIVLLAAIAFVIVRDARRVAPASDPDLIEARSGHDAAVRLRKRRAKAKAARKQRKRTR